MLMDFIPTKGSAVTKKAECNFLSINYKSYKSKKNDNYPFPYIDKKKANEVLQASPINVFNIKKAKHEVMQFGMSGFSNKERKEARVELAIKLGAKPERRKYINYKELKQQKKTDNELLKSQNDFFQLGKNSMGKSTAKGKSFDKKRKGKMDIINHYGIVKAADKLELKNAKNNRNGNRKVNTMRKLKT